jgi:radical SAM protein with 4Fe4S-binding SPASM domain
MGLLKSIQRDPKLARELAQCVEDDQPFRLTDMKLYLTRRCNLRCVMCDAWAAEPDGHAELSAGEVLSVIDQARALGLTDLKLFGGEPMLRRDLEVIVEHAAILGVRCTLITNGTLLTEQRARNLVEAGLAQLDLSLDAGDAGLHDAIRGVPGTWRRAMQGLQAVQAAAQAFKRRVAIRVNAVVMRANYLELPKLVDQLSSLAVDEITLNPVVPQAANRRKAAPRLVLEPADIAVYNAEVATAIAGHAPAYRLSKSRDRLYLYGTSQQDIEHASEGRYVDRLGVTCCLKPWYYAVVRENGDVVGCNTVKHPAARIGTVREASLEELWRSERYRTFRAACKPPHFAGCARCCYHFALVNKQIQAALVTTASCIP